MDAELLKAAGDLVSELLGDGERRKFDKAETPRERSVFMQEAAIAQAMGPEMYEATRHLAPLMRNMLFNTMATLQGEGLHDNEIFSAGLNKALTEPVYSGDNQDGSRGTSRTALFVPLSILEAELEQAKTLDLDGGKAARDRVQNRITRALVIAGMEAAGETVDDTADVVFARPDGSELRINENGDSTRRKSAGG